MTSEIHIKSSGFILEGFKKRDVFVLISSQKDGRKLEKIVCSLDSRIKAEAEQSWAFPIADYTTLTNDLPSLSIHFITCK